RGSTTGDRDRVEVVKHAVAITQGLGYNTGLLNRCIIRPFVGFSERLHHLWCYHLACLITHIKNAGKREKRIRVRKVDSIFSRRQGQPSLRNIRQNATKTDRNQQQGLKVLADRKEQQEKPDTDHEELADG